MCKFVQKWGLGWLGVYVYASRKHQHPMIDWLMQKIFHAKCFGPTEDDFTKRYDASLSQAKYWHGTGMYQYGKQHEVVSTFDSVVNFGALRPSRDVFDIAVGEIECISFTRIRMYARIYADMHHNGGG